MDDLCFLPARELVARMTRRELSAREVLAAHLARIDAINPQVNAVVTLVADQAMAAAHAADDSLVHGAEPGLLHGLPIAHKDLFDTAGIRTTRGSPIFADHIPMADAVVVAREKAAGAITIGKSNTPEFGLGSQTFNPVFGVTRNPYDLGRTCGGSSGGAAVGLACGMFPLADGSDTGGSLRNPASFCNVVGLRPSPGRVPGGTGGWTPLNVVGPMARSVEDLALLLAAQAGPDPRSPLSIDEPGAAFLAPLESNTRGLRIAWAVDASGIPFDPAVREVMASARPVFESMSCHTEDAWPDMSGANEVFQVVRAIDLASGPYGRLYETHASQMKETARWNIAKGLGLTGAEIAEAHRLRSELFLRVVAFFERFDAIALPVAQVPPFSVDQEYVTEVDGVQMQTYIDWMQSCSFISATAHPAISVPAGFTTEGLPVGIQLVGRYRGELSLLRLAHAFEQATHHARTRPPILKAKP